MELWTYLIKKESSLYSWLYLLFLIYPQNMFIVLFSFEHQIVLVVSFNDYHLFWHSETRLNYKLSWDQNFLTLLCLVWYTRTQIFLGGPIHNDAWFPLRNFTLPISLLNFVGKKFFHQLVFIRCLISEFCGNFALWALNGCLKERRVLELGAVVL